MRFSCNIIVLHLLQMKIHADDQPTILLGLPSQTPCFFQISYGWFFVLVYFYLSHSYSI